MAYDLKPALLIIIQLFFYNTVLGYSSAELQDIPKIETTTPTYDPKYGRSQRTKFLDAIHGTSEFTTEDQKKILAMTPRSKNDRYFLRLGINMGSHEVKLKNNSTSELSNESLLTKKYSSSKKAFEIASGFKWTDVAIELELFLTNNRKIKADPVFKNRTEKFESTIKTQAALLNVYYDFTERLIFTPYIGIGAGISLNKTNTRLSKGSGVNDVGNGEDEAHSKMDQAFNLILGSKIYVSRFSINLNARFTNFGQGTMRDDLDKLRLKNKHIMAGLGLGITWLI